MNPNRDSRHPSHDCCVRQMVIMSGRLVLDTYYLIGLDIPDKKYKKFYIKICYLRSHVHNVSLLNTNSLLNLKKLSIKRFKN